MTMPKSKALLAYERSIGVRPSREEMLMEIAETVAKRGTCDRKLVGAVIAKDGRPISCGYNGAPPGLPHCDENYHGWLMAPDLKRRYEPGEREEANLRQHGCRNATHAEANALAFAAKYGVPTDGAQLFVTVSPCENCARLLIAAGITTVYFKEAYRDRSGVELLDRALIPTYLVD